MKEKMSYSKFAINAMCRASKIAQKKAAERDYCCIHALLEKNDKVLAITPVFEPLISTAKEIGCHIIVQSLEPKTIIQPERC
ncbi:hypothetical protein PN36_22725 [Candidatus Thiomargarita nelsonii]|uniref:Uncharacterized protein n=1 Tax=Candidatus Thiomargarita nelsonii TaxID=1003181 RepID=A0A0A6PGK6_9GAMM|nr:hypothetical protein PN36_22725 [Candidatus Thiomargarita nelsonii]